MAVRIGWLRWNDKLEQWYCNRQPQGNAGNPESRKVVACCPEERAFAATGKRHQRQQR